MTWMIDKTKDGIGQLADAIRDADAVVVGAGAGLSSSAGFTYDGERFEKYFADFIEKYGFRDMYSAGFYPFYNLKERWAFWSRFIYINRYHKPPKPTYEKLLKLLEGKDYFVITTNVDHCFQKAGIEKARLFYTQGDYGLWQSQSGSIKKTWNNEVPVKKMLLAQGFWFEDVIHRNGISVEDDSEWVAGIGRKNLWQSDELDFEADWGELTVPEDESGVPDFSQVAMMIPAELIPYCAENGSPMAMNLRADDTFVQDAGWYRASERYSTFIERVSGSKVLFLDLGSGGNTPIIFKIPFMRWTLQWPDALYATVNLGEAYTAPEIREKSIVVDGDIDTALDRMLSITE